MNSRGVAFAADSAVSWGDHSRPSAQKIFSLSGRQPIAFMIYGSGTFAPTGLSWDRIFHKYNLYFNEKHGSEQELDTVEEYEKDFIDFLESLYSKERNQTSLSNDIYNHWAGKYGFMTRDGVFSNKNEKGNEYVDPNRLTVGNVKGPFFQLESYIDNWAEGSWFYSDDAKENVDFQYKVEQVKKNHSDSIHQAADWIMESALNQQPFVEGNWETKYEDLPDEQKNEADRTLKKLVLMFTRWLAEWGNDHGWKVGSSKADIVFGGFGRIDEYPKTIHLVTGSRVVGGKSDRYVLARNIVDPTIEYPIYEKEASIWKSKAFLEPFAQREYIWRMTVGQSEELANKIEWEVKRSLDYWTGHTLRGHILEIQGIEPETAESIISNIISMKHPEGYSNYVRSLLHEEATRTKNTFRNAVEMLSPPELAVTAMELISVQAKMHNIVNPQSTIDLPVDVCYLTRENGFIWYSRKNMPDLSINPRLGEMEWPGSNLG
tara:strand:+ start:125 stop:1591 length:1467 start_codon:yes stop_codon:yes gene_type:complete